MKKYFAMIMSLILIILAIDVESLYASEFEISTSEISEESTQSVNSKLLMEAQEFTIGTYDFTDFNNWQSGFYHWSTGKYTKNSQRLCIKDYLKTESGKTYSVSISNKEISALMREYDSNKKFLKTTILNDGDEYIASDKAVYVTVSLYSETNHSLSYEKYKALFENGFTIGFTSTVEEFSDTDEVDSFEFGDFENFESGGYNYKTGKAEVNSKRIRVPKLLKVDKDKYKARINAEAYEYEVCAYDENFAYIKNFYLKNGEECTLPNGTKFISLTIIKWNGEVLDYNGYKKLFENGFKPELVKSEKYVALKNDEITMIHRPVDLGIKLDDREALSDTDNIIKGYYNSRLGIFYDANGSYCSKNYFSVEQKKYILNSNDKRIKISIQERDKNGKILSNISDIEVGESYTPKKDTAKVLIGYGTNQWGLSVQTMIGQGLNLFFADDNVINETGTIDFSNADLSDFEFWRTGEYNTKNSEYGVNIANICTNKLLDVSKLDNRSLVANLRKKNIKFNVMEFTKDRKQISNTAYSAGKKITLSENTAYIGITLTGAGSYDSYKTLFEKYNDFFTMSPYEKYVYNRKMKDITAEQFMSEMTAGWNLGNSLDSHYGSWNGKENLDQEYTYGNITVTEDLIDYVKKAGFNTIRIPVTWVYNTYRDENGRLRVYDSWYSRVDDIIGYALKNDMYVMINSHHDQEFIYAGTTDTKFEQVKADAGDLWEDIAEHYKDYDEHLIFESYNEVDNVANSWNYSDTAAEQMNELNQIFVDEVRSSGGNNTKRLLCVQTLLAGHSKNVLNAFELPKDTVKNKLILQVHDYSSQFVQDIDPFFAELEKWSDGVGAPVVIGEWGSRSSYSPAKYRTVHASNYAARAAEHGIKLFYWDDGNLGNYGLINRIDFDLSNTDMINAIMNPKKYVNTDIEDYSSWEYFVYKKPDQSTGKLLEDKYWGTIMMDVNGKGIPIKRNAEYLQTNLITKNNAEGYKIHYLYFYDKDMNAIYKFNSSNGTIAKTFEIPDGTVYVRVGINSSYKATSESVYKKMINDGDMVLQFGWIGPDSVVVENTSESSIENVDIDKVTADNYDYGNFANWRSGNYNWIDGKYASYGGRICIKEYVEVGKGNYTVKISKDKKNLRMIIRELDSDYKLLNTVILKDGDGYIPANNTKYLGISLYYNNYKSVSYEDYRKMFEDGALAELIVR